MERPGIAPLDSNLLSVTEAQDRIVQLLTENHVSGARLEAIIMLSQLTGLSRTELLLEPGRPLSAFAASQLQEYLTRRLQGEPLAYVLGTCEFYGIEFIVDCRVLIPRPETELLVDLALKASESLARRDILNPVLADIGTGSGCVAIALAINLPGAAVYGTDISCEALEVAAANRAKHRLESRVTLVEGDLCASLPGQLNIVTANLPYVRTGEIRYLARELSWEPRLALDGGLDGIDCITRLIDDIKLKMASECILLLELGLGQAGQVSQLARKAFPRAVVSVHRDLSGIDRVVEIDSSGAHDVSSH